MLRTWTASMEVISLWSKSDPAKPNFTRKNIQLGNSMRLQMKPVLSSSAATIFWEWFAWEIGITHWKFTSLRPFIRTLRSWPYVLDRLRTLTSVQLVGQGHPLGLQTSKASETLKKTPVYPKWLPWVGASLKVTRWTAKHEVEHQACEGQSVIND